VCVSLLLFHLLQIVLLTRNSQLRIRLSVNIFETAHRSVAGIPSLGVTALPSYYTTACLLLRSGVLVSDDAPGESRQKLSKLKAKLLSEAQVAARHQVARVDRRSQSNLYWTLDRTLTQQRDHEWRSRLANSTILQTRRLETVSFSTWTHSQVQGLCGGMVMNRSLVWWLTIEHCSSENDLH
jgi:hypothetical protein